MKHKYTTLFEDEVATFWFDENGILCSELKKVPVTVEKQAALLDMLHYVTAHKKICYLTDITHIGPAGVDVQEFAAHSLPELCKAVAAVSSSAVGNKTYGSFVSSQGEPVPMKLFSHEEDAKEWLKAYL